MRRFLIPTLLVVSIALLIGILDLVGVLTTGRVLALLGWVFAGALMCVAIVVFKSDDGPEIMVEPWRCSTCGAIEKNYTRQCGSCHAWRAVILKTKRLVLREWTDFDLPAFAALSADPRVMEYLPGPLTREESDALAERIREDFAKHGAGLWAVEIPGVESFIGFIGLTVPRFEGSFTPCVEIDARLAFDHWNQGYATEGARAVLEFGFRQLRLRKIFAYAAAGNMRSRRVMEKLGMTRKSKDDFDHPNLEPNHRHRRQVLYRITQPQLTTEASETTGKKKPLLR